jgi:hypothetical protein
MTPSPYTTPLEELELSVRTYNCLRDYFAKVKTLNPTAFDICGRSRRQWHQVKVIKRSRIVLDEIEYALERIGCKLAVDTSLRVSPADAYTVDYLRQLEKRLAEREAERKSTSERADCLLKRKDALYALLVRVALCREGFTALPADLQADIRSVVGDLIQ